jgi:hypothetical protein
MVCLPVYAARAWIHRTRKPPRSSPIRQGTVVVALHRRG